MLFRVVTAPDRPEQCPVRQDLSGIANEVNQQIEFFWSQTQFFAILSRNVRVEINFECTRMKKMCLCLTRRFTSKGRANAREQLVHAERLRYIIVSA